MGTDVELVIDALARRCGIPQGTLAEIGLKTVQQILEYKESAFIQQFRSPLGSGSKAQLLYRCAVTARQYMAISRAAQSVNGPPISIFDATDPRATPGAPSWANQFPRPMIYAPTGSVGDETAAGAYATHLYQIAQYWEKADPTANDADARIKLATRRPDIGNLELNDVTMTQPLQKLKLVNELLEAYLDKNHAGLCGIVQGPKTLSREEVVSRLRYPGTTLPYHEAHDQALQGLLASKLTFAEIGRIANSAPPIFVQPKQASAALALNYQAQYQTAQLSPSQVSVLMEPEPESDDEHVGEWQQYLGQNYGSPSPSAIALLTSFSGRTGLSISEIRSLLCVSGAGTNASTVSVSSNYTGTKGSSANYGTRYISQDGQIYIYAVDPMTSDEPQRLAVAGHDKEEADAQMPTSTLFRLNKMFRLKFWTGLPYDELDAFIVACSTAAGYTANTIDWNLLRALGLYRAWSVNFGFSASEIRTLISTVQYLSVDDDINQFDAIFNSSGQAPLEINSTAPEYSYETPSPTVSALCAALGVDQVSFINLATTVQVAQNISPGKLNCSIECYSALYRLAMLARRLKLPVPGMLAMLERMPTPANDKNIPKLLDALAGAKPTLNPGTSQQNPSDPDFLDQLWALGEWVSYMRQARLTVAEVVAFLPDVKDGFAKIQATQAEALLVHDVCAKFPGAAFDKESILALDLPEKDDDEKDIDWGQVVTDSEILDTWSLIQVADAGKRKDKVAEALTKNNYKIGTTGQYDPLLNAFTEAQDEQYLVTAQALGRFLSRDSNVVHAMMQAFPLSDTTDASYDFLKVCLDLGATASPDLSAQNVDWEKLMTMMGKLARQAALVQRYALSVPALNLLKDERGYFGLDTDLLQSWNTYPFCIPIIYVLDAYSNWLSSALSEDNVLQYLRSVNTPSSLTSETAAAQLAAQLGEEQEQIQAAADWVTNSTTPSTGIIKTVAQMAKVLPLLELSDRTHMTVAALLKIPALSLQLSDISSSPGPTGNDTDTAYKAWVETASGVLSALTDTSSSL